MANTIKGAGLYQDRNSMGKLPMSQKMTEYFPQQYNPYNPDNYYAGDVADGTAQRMEGAALRRGVHDAQTDIDGRAIDANKPQAQMREAGAKQVGPGHQDFDVLEHLEESRKGPGMRYDVVPGKKNPITPGVSDVSLSPTPGTSGGGGREKTPDSSGSDKPIKNKPIKPVISKSPYRSKYLKTGLFGKGSHKKSVRRTHSISGKRLG